MNDDDGVLPFAPRPGRHRAQAGGGDAALAVFAADRARRAATRAARARRDPAGLTGADRARLAASVGVAAAAASRAAMWVAELAARAGSRNLAEYAAAVLACGRDLDPEDHENGGVPENVTFALSGLVLLGEPGLADSEGLALAAVGAIALAMPRTITTGDPAEQLPELAHHLDQAVGTGRAGT
ncbi:hypothetical protein ACFZDG_26705 [Kitasatospora xanthocidica]|uniref:hypothetical protein n=1 Tax=Kitasatospora xanthocidica TaxID=83382 RepID=UPI0036E684FB